jgi:hypothetical protein
MAPCEAKHVTGDTFRDHEHAVRRKMPDQVKPLCDSSIAGCHRVARGTLFHRLCVRLPHPGRSVCCQAPGDCALRDTGIEKRPRRHTPISLRKDPAFQALLLDRSLEAFNIRIQVGRPRRQAHRLSPDLLQCDAECLASIAMVAERSSYVT